MAEPYRVALERPAIRELDALPLPVQQRVRVAIEALSADPRPVGVEPIKGHRGAFRVRIGDYRVAYEINDRQHQVTVFKIGHRREVYRRL